MPPWNWGADWPESTHWRRQEGWGMVGGGMSPPPPTRGSGGVSLATQRVAGLEPGQKHIVTYFESHRTLLCAPICWSFKFVKQFWGKANVCGAIAPLPQRRTAPVVSRPMLCSGKNLQTYTDRQTDRERISENNGCLAAPANMICLVWQEHDQATLQWQTAQSAAYVHAGNTDI